MKYPYLIIFLVFISCQGPAVKLVAIHKTKIDSLVTEEQVKQFLVSTDAYYENFTVMKAGDYRDTHSDSLFCKSIADSLKIDKSFYKADFDQNGYTDLLVSGNQYSFGVLVIMNHAKNKYTTTYLSGDAWRNSSFPKLDSIEGIPVIDYSFKTPRRYHDTTSCVSLTKTTLIYRFGGFVEYNAAPVQHVISKVDYEAFGCWGTAPVFKMTVAMSGKGLLDAIDNNKDGKSLELKGKYSGTIKSTQYEQLTELLNYINFTNLLNDYSIWVSDMPEGVLKITYDDGKTIVIDDYGMQGTYGLQRVYGLLEELRFNQVWKKQVS